MVESREEWMKLLKDQNKIKGFEIAMKVLHDLTTGGSEFYNDPERCAAVIRDIRESQMRAIVKFKKQRDLLLVAVKSVLNMVDGDGQPPNWDLIRNVVQRVEKGEE